MKMSLTFVCLMLVFGEVNAKTWTVSPRPGASFTTISGAVGSSSVLSGDTILVSGSAQAYAGFNTSKRLTIIGPGFFLNENTGLQADTNSARVSSAVTLSGAGTTVTGMHFQQSLFVNADNITITRCKMQTTAAGTYPLYIYAKDSVVVRQCYIIQSANYYYSTVTILSGATQIFIQNNFIEYAGGNISYGSFDINGTITGDISNNVIFGNFDNVSGSFTFNNNILRSGAFSTTGVTPYNNIANGTQFGNQNGNQENVSMSSVFVGTGSQDAQWQLAGGSPALGAGFGGVDCGMFDNSAGYGYVLSGIPAVPSIYEFTADPGLNNVTVKVKSHN
ncbi:MAG: hypothetical protein KDC45_08635 [Bacteroidetes bacterium]|nr:hypothetical protein [Bacteroidota bacterium]